MAVTGVALTVLTFTGQMPPALLLTFTFVLGSGSVISLPAYQSLIPDLVPRAQVAAASTLGSISVNVARAIGPAIAGVLIARIGVGAVFAINAATFLAYGIVVAAWHPPVEPSTQLPERFVSALRAGGRYVRYSPVMRRMLLARLAVPGARQCVVGAPPPGRDAAPAVGRERLWAPSRGPRCRRSRGVIPSDPTPYQAERRSPACRRQLGVRAGDGRDRADPQRHRGGGGAASGGSGVDRGAVDDERLAAALPPGNGCAPEVSPST